MTPGARIAAALEILAAAASGERPADADLIKRYRDMGVARVVGGCPPEPADKTLPLLDQWAGIIRQVNG